MFALISADVFNKSIELGVSGTSDADNDAVRIIGSTASIDYYGALVYVCLTPYQWCVMVTDMIWHLLLNGCSFLQFT